VSTDPRHFIYGDDFLGKADDSSYLLLLSDKGLWWPDQAETPLLPPGTAKIAVPPHAQIRLGTWDGIPVFACRLNIQTLPGFQEIPQREGVLRLDAETATIACMGRALLLWLEHAKFCPDCGAPLQNKRGERSRECTKCGRPLFPTIAPAVIVAISKGNSLLLAHNSRFQNGMYGLIAGFVEAGESLEQAVAREVREEVGIELTDIRYWGSQSWPYPCSLMLGFTAEYASGDLCPDGVEITDAKWFTADSFPITPRPGSIASVLISHWLQQHRDRK